MDETETQHPGRDQELTERYALGRLSPEERNLFESHLRECAACSRLVEQELRIAAGIRRAGREDLLARLRTRSRQHSAGEPARDPARRIPWPRVLAIAASLLLLVGIGVVRFWIHPEGNETRIPEISQQIPEKDRDGGFAAPPPAASSPAPAGSAGAGKTDQRFRAEAKSAPLMQDARSKSVVPERVNEAEPVPAPAARPSITEERLDDALRGEDKSDTGIMVEGTIVETSVGGAITGMKKERDQDVQVLQGAANTARSAVQSRQKGGRNILTRMENVNNQLQITLYPETLFTDESLRNARIEPFGKDSLRVTIGNQQILYRIPQQLQQSAPAR